MLFSTDTRLANVSHQYLDKPNSQLIPLVKNPIIIAQAFNDGSFTLTSKDMDFIQRELEKAFDYYIKSSPKPLMEKVTEDDILIDKVSKPYVVCILSKILNHKI